MPLRTIRPRVAAIDTRTVKPPPKTVDPHYSTPEHRRWRNAILTRAAGHCEGIVAGGERCNRTGLLSADHVVELRDGGDPFGAGIALCRSCHATKTYAARAARMAAPVGGEATATPRPPGLVPKRGGGGPIGFS